MERVVTPTLLASPAMVIAPFFCNATTIFSDVFSDVFKSASVMESCKTRNINSMKGVESADLSASANAW